MTDYVSIAEWSKINGRTRGAGVNALKSIPGALNEKGKVLASTPWPHAPRKGGWPKGRLRGMTAKRRDNYTGGTFGDFPTAVQLADGQQVYGGDITVNAPNLTPEQRAIVERGLAQSANGETFYIGSFAQYATED